MEEERPSSVASRRSQRLQVALDTDRRFSATGGGDPNARLFELPRAADPLRRGVGLRIDGSSRGTQELVDDIGGAVYPGGLPDYPEGLLDDREDDLWRSLLARSRRRAPLRDEDAPVPYDAGAVEPPRGGGVEGRQGWDESPPEEEPTEERRFDFEALLQEMASFELRFGTASSEATTADTGGGHSEGDEEEGGKSRKRGDKGEKTKPPWNFDMTPDPKLWPVVKMGLLGEEEESAEGAGAAPTRKDVQDEGGGQKAEGGAKKTRKRKVSQPPWDSEASPDPALWFMVQAGALREDEARLESSGAEPPRRRYITKEARKRFLWRACSRWIGHRCTAADACPKCLGELQRCVDHLQVFVEAREKALADLHACEEHAPGHVTPRAYTGPAEPIGWQSASMLGPRQAEGMPRSEGPRKLPARLRARFGSLHLAFLEAKARADAELEEAARASEEQPPPRREPAAIPEHVVEQLIARSSADSLAETMERSSTRVFAGDGSPVPVREPTPISESVLEQLLARSKVDALADMMQHSETHVFAGQGYDIDWSDRQPSVWPKSLTLKQRSLAQSSSSSSSHDADRGLVRLGRRRDVVWCKLRLGRMTRISSTKGTRFLDEAEYVLEDKTEEELVAEGAFWAAWQASLPVYLSAQSAASDLSLDVTQGKARFVDIAQQSPGMWKVANIFAEIPDDWDRKVEGQVAVADGGGGVTRALPQSEGDPSAPQTAVNGVRLGDLQELVQKNRGWFEAVVEDRFSGKMRMKTMYEVCPELIMPATTRQEWIVKLAEEDLPRLTPHRDGGILESASDLTIVGAERGARAVSLGGQEVPVGLTFHGKLRRGGPIRQWYWERGDGRRQEWRAKDASCLGPAAQVPDDLEGEGKVGEATDRVWTAGELHAGDYVVLRAGVSYIDMLAELSGGHHALHSFASHFWGEETIEFVKTLERHAKALEACSQVPAEDRVYYVCTFNNNQHRVELGSGWESSPFNRALEYVANMAKLDKERHDAVMLVDRAVQPLRRKWCVFEAWRCTVLELPLRLFCTEGEITRESALQGSAIAKEVLKQVEEIDVQNNATCTVKADADMINDAIEDSPGGFVAVHAKLRTRVLDLLTFIGSLAVSIDPVLGKKVDEVELQVTSTEVVGGKAIKFDTKTVAEDICSQKGALGGTRLLLVAPAGSGKSVFTRSLVRCVVERSRDGADSGTALFPARVPLAEMAKIIRERRAVARGDRRRAAEKLNTKAITEAEYASEVRRTERLSFDDLFEEWARSAFLSDAEKVLRPEKRKLLILDGFDEAAETRADIISWLRVYLRKHPDDSMMLTTRPSGLDGVGMSSGRVRNPEKARVLEVDELDQGGSRGEDVEEEPLKRFDMMAISKDLPLGTVVTVRGPRELDCAVIVAEDGRLPLEGGVLRVAAPKTSSKVDLKTYIATLPEQEIETAVESVDGCRGAGARVKVTVKGYVKTLLELRRKKKDNDLEVGHTMTANDMLDIEVLAGGTGYSTGGTVRLPKSAFRQAALAEADESMAEQMNTYQAQKAAQRTMLIDRIDTYNTGAGQPEQELLDLEAQLLESETPGEYIRLTIQRTQRFIAVAPQSDGAPLELKGIAKGCEVEEMLIREQLAKEMSFRDFEIDEIDSSVAARIVRNVVGGGADMQVVDRDVLEAFPSNLWDRPLMANLFAQYLDNVGIAKAKSLDPTVAELSIFRFIADILIKQAARVVVDDPRHDGVAKQQGVIRRILEAQSRQKMNRGDRLWYHHELKHLYQDAVRGHLRLFEPQSSTAGGEQRTGGGRASEDSRMLCQFYHFRIQEFLAAEAWNSAGHSTEEAARQMVRQPRLVQGGLAPLRFLIQARLEASANAAELSLDFQRECEKELVTSMQYWLPMQLRSLSISFPRFRHEQVFPRGDNSMPLPQSLTRLDLDFSRCRLPVGGLRDVRLEHMQDLQQLSLNLDGCTRVTEEDLAYAFERLPSTTRDLQVSARQGAGYPLAALIGKVSANLTRFTLDVSRRFFSDSAVSEVGARLPRSLEHFELRLRRCSEVTSLGLLGVFRDLPPGLRTLMVDFRFSMGINTSGCGARGGKLLAEPGGLASMCDDLPKGLKTLDLVFNRYVGDMDLIGGAAGGGGGGIGESLPEGLETLRLDFRHACHLTDGGVGALSKCIPRSLLELSLKVALCQRVSCQGIEELAKGLPETLRTISLDFSSCKRVDDDALELLGRHLPVGLRRFSVNMSGCRAVGNSGVRILFSAQLPLESLVLVVDKCDALSDEGLGGVAGVLPKTVREFTLSCRGCRLIGDAGVASLCGGLAEGPDLSKLCVDLAGCGGSIVRGRRGKTNTGDAGESSDADFAGVGDRGVQAIGGLLRAGLQHFSLSVAGCTAVSDCCLESLTEGLLKARAPPASALPRRLELSLHFKDCHAVTSHALRSYQHKLAGDKAAKLLCPLHFDTKTLGGSIALRRAEVAI